MAKNLAKNTVHINSQTLAKSKISKTNQVYNLPKSYQYINIEGKYNSQSWFDLIKTIRVLRIRVQIGPKKGYPNPNFKPGQPKNRASKPYFGPLKAKMLLMMNNIFTWVNNKLQRDWKPSWNP